MWAVWYAGVAEGRGRWCAEERQTLAVLPGWQVSQARMLATTALTDHFYQLARETRVADGAAVFRVRTVERWHLDAALSPPINVGAVLRQRDNSRRDLQAHKERRLWRALDRLSWPVACPPRMRPAEESVDVAMAEEEPGDVEMANEDPAADDADSDDQGSADYSC